MKRLAVIIAVFAVALHAQAALILGSLSGGATKDLSPEILLDTYTESGGHLVIAQVRLADLNAAAAQITLRFEHTTAADVVLAYKADIYSDAKFADANTRYGYRMSNAVYLANGEKLKVYGTSTNTSDVASYTITVLDANYAAALIGAPVALDSGTATLAGILAKMADDGSGYDATTDSMRAIATAIAPKATSAALSSVATAIGDVPAYVWAHSGTSGRTITGGTVDTLTNAPASVTPGDIWGWTGNRYTTGGTVDTVTNPVTAGTVSDKTGYSLSVTPPTAATIADAVLDEALGTHAGFLTTLATGTSVSGLPAALLATVVTGSTTWGDVLVGLVSWLSTGDIPGTSL